MRPQVTAGRVISDFPRLLYVTGASVERLCSLNLQHATIHKGMRLPCYAY